MVSAPLLLVLATAGILLGLFVFFLRSHFLVVTVRQQSMYPTLVSGDRILALRHWSSDQLGKGQIVVLKMDHLEPSLAGSAGSASTLYIKRIVGVAGETIVTTQEGEACVPQEYVPENPDQHLWHIPASSILVRGDNRAQSLDSHIWGSVPVEYVQAVMLIRLQRNSLARHTDVFIQRSFLSLPVGEQAPAFTASTLQGERVTLQTYRNRPLLLVFFQPARILTEHFFRRRWHVLETVNDETLIVLVSGASTKQTRAYLKKVQIDFPIIVAPCSRNSMFQDYMVSSFPHYCYIDDLGKVLSTGSLSVTI